MFRLAHLSVLLAAVPVLTAAQQTPQPPQPQLAPLPATLPRTHTPQPTTAAISAADLMTRLYIFADDSMEGRATGTWGNIKGTAYLAAELKRMGLQPAGDSGTYFQALPKFLPLLGKGASMRVGNTALTLTNDFIPAGPHNLENRALAVVYGGLRDSSTTLTPAQTAGKLVVFTIPASATPVELLRKVPYVEGAAAIALVLLDSMPPDLRASFAEGSVGLRPRPKQPVILLSGAAAKQLFGKNVDSIPVGTTGQQVAVAYTFVASARNVVAILPGSDPVLRNQYVAIGAHNDHIGKSGAPVGDHDSLRVFTHVASPGGAETGGNSARATPAQLESINAELAKLRRVGAPRADSIYNGADDDGSGSVSMLEIAEYFAAMPVKPKRSILFVWHTGEEAGLLGSAWFTTHSTVPLDSIVVQLNADMIGRGDASDVAEGSANYLQVVGSRRLSTELGNLIDTVNTTGRHGFVFDYVRGEQYYTRSDHYKYARFGIPIAFFITGTHSDYHQVTDEPQYINYTKMARITSLISDIAVHVANLNHRLVVDHPPSP